MKLTPHPRVERGSTLAAVLMMCLVTLMVLGSALTWVTSNNTLSQRNNEYFRTQAVAEAATEKVLTRILTDYKRGGDRLAIDNATAYTDCLPTSADDPVFGSYLFTDGQGNRNKIYVRNIAPTEYKILNSQYRGLRGYSTPFRIIANAQQTDTMFQITTAVRQDIEVTTIPLFQFAIFYNIDLEINPGPDMTIGGRVHGNENIYMQPLSTLRFREDVTAAGTIYDTKKPGDPSSRTPGTIVFDAGRDSGASALTLPIGTDNTPTAVRKVIEPPPPGESVNSALGSQRLYNKADMIVTIPATGPIVVSSGVSNGKGTTVPQQQWDASVNAAGGFLKQSAFYNARETRTVRSLDIDVGKLRAWSAKATNILRPTWAQGDVTIIYVDDQRPNTTLSQGGVRMVNGAVLPTKGLTVVTPNPVYVQGDYNTGNGTATSSGNDTANTRPAALIGDAINILSTAWSDANSTLPIASRVARDTTVNAAFLSGIVETVSGSYSGGVENYPRFLENWTDRNLYYNGSMVVMFPSQVARSPWGGNGGGLGVYNPPVRKWAYDTNFRDVAKLPPGTPVARKIVRNVWKAMAPNTVAVTP